MVLYKNELVIVALKTTAINSDGVLIGDYDYDDTPKAIIYADVQPLELTQATIELYGLNKKTADAKKMFFDKDDNILIGDRVLVDDTQFEVKGLNKWRGHYEAILVTIENE